MSLALKYKLESALSQAPESEKCSAFRVLQYLPLD